MHPPTLLLDTFSYYFYYLFVGIPSGHFPSRFHSKTLFAPPQSPICPSPHPFLLDLVTGLRFDKDCWIWHSSLCNSSQFPITASLLCQKFFLCILFWNALFLCFTLIWETRFNIYSEQQTFFYMPNWKTKYYGPNGSGYSPHTVCSYFIHSHNFDLLVSSTNIELYATFPNMLLSAFIVSFCPPLSCQDILMNYSLIPEWNSTLLS